MEGVVDEARPAPRIYGVAVDPAEYNYFALIGEYSASPEAVAEWDVERRRRNREIQKRRREVKKRKKEAEEKKEKEAEAKAGTKRQLEGAESCQPTKKRRLDEFGSSETTRVIDLVEEVEDDPIVEESSSSVAEEKREDVQFTVLKGEHMRIISARFIDLHRKLVMLEYDVPPLDAPGERPMLTVRPRRDKKQSVGYEERRANLPTLGPRLGRHLARWPALFDAKRLPMTVIIEKQVDDKKGARRSYEAPMNFALAEATATAIAHGDETRHLGVERDPTYRSGKAGVKRDEDARKVLSVQHAKVAVRHFNDRGGMNIISSLETAGLKLDDFADCYNLFLKTARAQSGIHIVEHK